VSKSINTTTASRTMSAMGASIAGRRVMYPGLSVH
jgi:hypothetical protein